VAVVIVTKKGHNFLRQKGWHH